MTRIEKHRKAFGGKEKPIIGCLHLKALPGTPMWNRNMSIEEHIDKVMADAAILKEAGFDAFVFANEEDYPYVDHVGPEIVATYARIVTAVTHEFKLPFGVGIMMDPYASVALAKATGASFTRGFFCNTCVTDFGLINRSVGDIMRYAKQINAEDVNIYTAIEGHFGEFIDPRSVQDRYRTSKFIIPCTGFIMSGPSTGQPPQASTLASLKEIDDSVPLIFNSGATPQNVGTLLPYCDGVLVGTSLKKDGYLFNPVDRNRAMAFMDAVRSV